MRVPLTPYVPSWRMVPSVYLRRKMAQYRKLIQQQQSKPEATK